MTDFLDCVRPAVNQCMGCQAGWELEPTAAGVQVHRVRGGYPGELVVCTRHRYADAEPGGPFMTVRPAEPIDEDIDRAINEALDAEERKLRVQRALSNIEHILGPTETLSPSDICHRSTWCCLRKHPPDVPCDEKSRAAMDRTDFGPRRAVKVGWR